MPAFDTYFENYEHEQWLREKELEEYRQEQLKLKPCAKCGGEGEWVIGRDTLFDYKNSYYVRCKNCGNKTDNNTLDFIVADRWNNQKI